MNGQMTHLKNILVVLAVMAGAVSLPVGASTDKDVCNVSTAPLPFTNINLRAGGYKEGDIIKDFSFPITYTCRIYNGLEADGWFQPSLTASQDFVDGIKKLAAAGLALDLQIQDTSPATGPVKNMPWSVIKNTGTGSSYLVPFGTRLYKPGGTADCKTDKAYCDQTHQALLRGRISVDSKYQGAPVVVDIVKQTALEIIPLNVKGQPYQSGTGIRIPAFSIRILPNNLGRVCITPSTVKFGRMYATSDETLTRTESFTVKAEQKTGAPVTFGASLNIEFDTGGLLLTADNQAIKLSDQTTKEENGLQLSITDSDGNKVTFNKPVSMGRELSFGPGILDSIQKNYTAKVEPIPGAKIKTGTFNAAMTVTVTYQ